MTAIVLRADARCLPLPDGCVDLIVTSPPYWNLRDYRDSGKSLAGQIGGEETWQEYIANLLDCTREWMRVLKPAGSLFVNIGDKYANDAKWGGATSGKHVAALHGKTGIGRAKVQTGIPPKSLIGLPSRYAIACMDELGLTWRRDGIWHKTNPMPESTEDRCATRHEYLLHFVQQSHYFAAVDEIREASTSQSPAHDARRRQRITDARLDHVHAGRTSTMNALGKLPGSVWEIPLQPLIVPPHLALDHFAAFPFELPRRCILGWSPSGICLECGEGRFPVVDRRPMVVRPSSRRLAAQASGNLGRTAPGGTMLSPPEATIIGYACACTPYTDHPGVKREGPRNSGKGWAAATGDRDIPSGGYGNAPRTGPWREYHLDRWTRAPVRPAVIADPFGGTGTTALVANVLGRHGISFDLSADYCRLAAWRTTDPGERARAMQIPKPPPVPDGQGSLFDTEATA